MNVESYIETQIAELNAQLSDKRVELASCMQPADWAAFSTSAAKKLDDAYKSFCSAIKWRVTRRWHAGTSSFTMGALTKAYLLQYGAFRLVASVEERAFVRFPALHPSPDSPYDYPELNSAANRE